MSEAQFEQLPPRRFRTEERTEKYLSALRSLRRERNAQRWVTAKEAAHYISCTVDSFRRLVRKGTLPPSRRREGRNDLYNLGEIDDVFDNNVSYEPIRKRDLPAPPRLPALFDAAAILAASAPFPPSGGCGIYFLIAEGRIVYVGQSINVLWRLGQHAAERVFDAWHWIPCAREGLDQLEHAYIRALRPAWNKTHMLDGE